MKAARSLKSRALQLLAQRDQSRLELRRKLLRHARGRGRRRRLPATPTPTSTRGAARRREVDALLDWLEANRFLSDARFAESRVHARAQRFGNQRIRSELAQHARRAVARARGVARRVRDRRAPPPFARAASPPCPASAAERAAQSRFLLGRGFSPELVQRLMRRLARADAAASEGAPGAD